MKSKLTLGIVFAFVIVVSIGAASALTLDQLLQIYQSGGLFNVDAGVLNVTSAVYGPLDTGGSPLGDYLQVNLTTTGAAGSYTVVGDLFSGQDFISTNQTNVTLSAGTNIVPITFPARTLTLTAYNLSIRVYQGGNLIFRKEPMTGITYITSQYEAPDITLGITSDTGLNNESDSRTDYIQLNGNINVPAAGSYDITTYIGNATKTVFGRSTYSLSAGSNSISLYVPSKELRKARLSGAFNVKLVEVNYAGRTYYFKPTYTTSSYSTSTLDPKASVITGTISESTVMSGNKIDKLQFNIQEDINETGTYTTESLITNQYGEYVSTISKTSSLSSGIQTVQLELNASEAYDSKVNGPYVLSYVKIIRQNKIHDILENAYASNSYASDNFTSIPLPDVALTTSDISVAYSGNGIADVNITVHNLGNGVAFDTDVSLIDDQANIIRQTAVNLISAGGIKTVSFSSVPVTPTIYAFADLRNKVEESDEQNNLASNTIPTTQAFIATNVDSGQAPLIVQFTGSATGVGPFTYDWDFGDNTGSSQQSPSHTYNTPGQYMAILTVTGSLENATATKIITVGSGPGSDWSQFHGDEAHTGQAQQGSNAPFKLKWTFNAGSPIHSSPSVFANQIYVRADNGNLYALDYNGQQQWVKNVGPWCSDVGQCIGPNNIERGTVAIDDSGTIYAASNTSLYALYQNGSTKWSYSTENAGGLRDYVSAAPVLSQNKILFGTATMTTVTPKIYALDTLGQNLWNVSLSYGAYSTPAILGNVIYAVNDVYGLSAHNLANGGLIWSSSALSELSIYSSPAADPQSNTLYLGDGAGGSSCKSLKAFDANNGSLKWRLFTESFLTNTPAVSDGIFFGLYNGKVYALNETGGVKWRFSAGTGPVYSSPAATSSMLFFGADDQSVYGLDKETGDLKWSYSVGSQIQSSPALTGNMMYVGANNGNVYAFEAYPLIVNAGSDQTVQEGTSVTLTAQANDGQGSITGYDWREGTSLLSTSASFSQVFAPGKHKIKLTVFSSSGVNVSDYVDVNINYYPPQPTLHGTLIGATSGSYSGEPYSLTSWYEGQDGIAGYRRASGDPITLTAIVKWPGACGIDPCQVRAGTSQPGTCFTNCQAYDKETFKCIANFTVGSNSPGTRTDRSVYLYTDGSASTLIDNVSITYIAEGVAPTINSFTAPGTWKDNVDLSVSLTDPVMSGEQGSGIGWMAFYNNSIAPSNFMFNYVVDDGQNFIENISWTTNMVANGENKTLNICAVAYDKLKYNSSSCTSVYVDKSAPVISNVNSTTTYNSSAITWNTDESSNSIVDYGTSNALGLTASNSSLVTGHNVAVNGLSPNTYYYTVTSCDAVNNCAVSAMQTFNIVANTNLSDLTIISATPYNSSANQGVFVPFVIKNIGNIPSGSFYWKVYANGPSLDMTNAGAPIDLAPNQTITVYPFLNYTAAGTYSPNIVVDDANLVTELSETNNNMAVTVVIS